MPLARHDSRLFAVLTFALFLLTCLLRGMTWAWQYLRTIPEFLLTCLLRGMTCQNRLPLRNAEISTHMPLARHDSSVGGALGPATFLLTCLLRGMTFNYANIAEYYCHFYSHASCEAWLTMQFKQKLILQFLLTCLLRGMTRPDGKFDQE